MTIKDSTYKFLSFFKVKKTFFILFLMVFMGIGLVSEFSTSLVDTKFEISETSGLDYSDDLEANENTDDISETKNYFMRAFFYDSLFAKKQVNFFKKQEFTRFYHPDIQLPPPRF